MATAAFAGLLNCATMAKTHNDIRNQLEQALKGQPVTIMGRVVKVDASGLTCDIDNDGVVIYGVRLQSIVGGNGGVVVYPSVGSQALCLRIEESDSYMVVSASKIDKVAIADGTGKTEDLIGWMAKVNADFQTLQNLLSVTTVAGNGAPLGIVFNPQTPSVTSPI